MLPENLWHQRLPHGRWGELGGRGTGRAPTKAPTRASPKLEQPGVSSYFIFFPTFRKSLSLGRLPFHYCRQYDKLLLFISRLTLLLIVIAPRPVPYRQ